MATQTVWALGNAPVQASGVQVNFFDSPDVTIGELPSLAAPVGRIGAAWPVRGREELIARIEQARLTPDSQDKVWVLHGLGGVGKSMTALAIARQAEASGADVWWMHAANLDSLATLMVALAARLGASQEIRTRNVGDLVWERLRVHSRPWLLVLDGLDDPAGAGGPTFADGTGLVRPFAGGRGCVVITSRESRADSWGSWCELLEVPVLPPDVASQVLLDHAPHLGTNTVGAKLLGAALGGLPLALQMAGDALTTAAETPHELIRPNSPRTFDEYRCQIEGDPDDGSPAVAETTGELLDVLTATWKISLDAVSGTDREDAVMMLGFLSCFADAPIPVAVLLHLEALRLALPQIDIAEDVSRQLRSLESAGLLRIEAGSTEGGSRNPFSLIYMHRLVRRCCRADARIRENLPGMQSQATVMINSLVSTELREKNDWRLWAVLEPHVFDITAAMVSSVGFSHSAVALMCELGILAAKSLQACGAYEEAGRRLRDVESLQRAHVPEPDERHLELSEAFASLARRRGKLAEAAKAYNDIYGSYILTYGLLDRRSIRVGAGLAGVMHEAGDAASAAELLDTILDAAREGLGEQDRQTLALRANIACLLYEVGSREIAEEQIRNVLADQEAALGARAEDTLRTRLNLAQMCRFRQAFAESAVQYGIAIAAFDAVYGVWSTQSLSTRVSMAGLVRDQGRIDDAEALYRSVLADAQKFLGPDHLITRRAERRLRTLVLREGPADSEAFHGMAADVRMRISTTARAAGTIYGATNPSNTGWILGAGVPENHSGTLSGISATHTGDSDPGPRAARSWVLMAGVAGAVLLVAMAVFLAFLL